MLGTSRLVVAALVVVMALATTSFAVPTLQLDIVGGVYDTETDTVVGPSGEEITLVALLTPNPAQGALIGDTYYISAALVPAVDVASALGSFTFDGGDPVNVTSDMAYGVPPLEALQEHDAGDLPRHSIFETYFTEFNFTFDPGQQVSPYDTQLAPGSFDAEEGGMGSYYQLFTVNTSLLAHGVNLHFDLYSTVDIDGPLGPVGVDSIDERDVSIFAPFSHDAETNRNGMPEPATLCSLTTPKSRWSPV